MSSTSYRRLRITIGALVLGFCTLAFVDIGHWLPALAARIGLWLQFTPSLLGLTHGAGWLGMGAIAVILLTLLFGRVYCAMLCPLGVLMDLSAWLTRRSGKKRKLPYQSGHPWLRRLAVGVCALGLLAGTALPLGFLDPYSIFGKITASTLRPLLGSLNHRLSLNGVMDPVDVSPVAWTTTGVALGLLSLVVISAIFRGRLWCNTVCPVGTVLGFFSKHAWFRLKIDNSACVACTMCERSCPAQCIDFKNYEIDHSRCVMCLNCVTSCKRSGISLTQHPLKGRGAFWKRPADEAPTHSNEIQSTDMSLDKFNVNAHSNIVEKTPSPSIGRRLFIASSVAIPAAAMAANKSPKGVLTQHNKRAVLPPGARSLAHFQSNCTGCQLCVANCPDQVLRPSITQHGLAGFLQPYQDFTVSFCSYNCSNCSQVCPTGAIQPLTIDERRAVRTGVAHFIEDLCVVKTNGTSCGACNEHCPTQAVHMIPYKDGLTIPEVDTDLCIGCGGCEFICPVRPDKAIVVDGLPVHERAKVVVLGQENTVRKMEEEFPF